MVLNSILLIYELCLFAFWFYTNIRSIYVRHNAAKTHPDFGRKRDYTFWIRYYFNPNLSEIPIELKETFAKQRILDIIAIFLLIIYLPLFFIYRY